MRYFSPSTGGFYDTDLHGDAMPADVVKITAKRHEALIEAQAAGAEILAGPKGPIAKHPEPVAGVELARARRLVKREARRRILAIASLERQTNDAALMAQAALQLAALGATELDVAAAAARRERVDAVRAASNALELELEAQDPAELAKLTAANIADHARWPHAEDAA